MLKSFLSKSNNVVMVIVMAFIPSLATAGWLDDWQTATVSTPPSSFKGTERSYYDFGSYGGRWRSNSLSPISIQPARLKAGCGGIDVMLGGMSFGNADQLVKKLQQILQNSPTVALDLAINVLCEQCANSMKWIEDKINALNNIQLDSCKASKAIVYTAASALDPDNNRQELQSPMADYMQSSGLSTAYDEVTKKWASTGGQVPSTQVADAVSECPYALRSLFATPEGLPMSTLFDNITNQMSLSPAYAQAIRGIIGDVGIASSQGMYVSWIIEPCHENKEILKSGNMTEMWVADQFGICSKSADAQADMEAWVNRLLTQIANKMINKTDLDDEERSFAYNYMNGLHRQILRFGLMSNQGDAVQQINMLTPLIVKHITVQMVGDLTSLLRQMMSQAKEVVKKQSTSTNPTNQGKCEVTLFADTLATMEEFSDKASRFYAVIRDKENGELQKLAGEAQMAVAFQQQENLLRQRLSQQFGNQGAGSLIK